MTIIAILLVAVIVLEIFILAKKGGNPESIKRDIIDSTSGNIKNLGDIIITNQKNTDEIQSRKFSEMDKNIMEKQGAMNKAVSVFLYKHDSTISVRIIIRSLRRCNRQLMKSCRKRSRKRWTSPLRW